MFFKKFLAFLLLTGTALCASAHDITAKSWLVADAAGNTVQAEKQDKIRSIASITKLMTVLVILDQQKDLERVVTVRHNKAIRGHIPTSLKQASVNELISLALISSDNSAAFNLCRSYTVAKKRSKEKYPCVAAMNKKAQELGMRNTVFVEPTGLDRKNVSTAQDLVKLVIAASDYSVVLANSNKSSVQIKTPRQEFKFKNTNSLVGQHHVMVSKTGWTYAAGGCLVMLMETAYGPRIIVVLGSQSTRTRIPEAESLSTIPEQSKGEIATQ